MKTKSHFFPMLLICLVSFGMINSCAEPKKEESADSKQTVEEVKTPKFDLVKAKAEIQAANDAFCQLVAAKDSVGLTDLYTKDAKFMAAGEPSAVGSDQIRAAMYSIFESGITNAKITTKEVMGSEELLVEESNVLLFVGDQQVADEKALVVWKKVDGKWKLFRDIFNSNWPAE